MSPSATDSASQITTPPSSPTKKKSVRTLKPSKTTKDGRVKDDLISNGPTNEERVATKAARRIKRIKKSDPPPNMKTDPVPKPGTEPAPEPEQRRAPVVQLTCVFCGSHGDGQEEEEKRPARKVEGAEGKRGVEDGKRREKNGVEDGKRREKNGVEDGKRREKNGGGLKEDRGDRTRKSSQAPEPPATPGGLGARMGRFFCGDKDDDEEENGRAEKEEKRGRTKEKTKRTPTPGREGSERKGKAAKRPGSRGHHPPKPRPSEGLPQLPPPRAASRGRGRTLPRQKKTRSKATSHGRGRKTKSRSRDRGK